MPHIRGNICSIINIIYTFKVYILYIITCYIPTHSFAHNMKNLQVYKNYILSQMQDYSYDSAILICVIVCFLEWKRIVTALVRSIVHVNIILYMEIWLTVNDADHIATQRHILRNKSQF